MATKLVSALLIAIGIIHLLPLAGVLGAHRLSALYTIELSGSDIEILMRHRAVLFGLLGGFFCYAAVKPEYQPLAFVFAFVSVVSFLALALQVGGFNGAIRRVVIVDIVALVLLLAAVAAYVGQNRAL